MKINQLISLLLILFMFSCSPIGPNYNKYNTHNQSVKEQMKEVYKVDKLSKKAMIKHRNRNSKQFKKLKLKFSHRKYIK